MSAGYASRLSAYPNKGVVGLPELKETFRARTQKLQKLTEMVRKSKHLVILTGAGISTSAGIPDFRGPKGIWTMEKQQQQREKRKQQQPTTTTMKRGRGRPRKRKRNDVDDKEERTDTTGSSTNNSDESDKNNDDNNNRHDSHASMDFSKAEPTITHRAIATLASTGKLKYCVTQNVDGLHRRSGLSRSVHCAIHGCAFTEQCESCGLEFFRDFDVGGMSFRPTGRTCSECDGNLVDTLLDWEDALPQDDFARAEAECDKADLVLCLGTSLRIDPAGSLPLRAEEFVIVNKQKTAKDEFASLIVHANVDDVMEHLLRELGYGGWKEAEQPPIQRQWRAALRDNTGEVE